jgi:hypothetical protein
MKIEAGRVAPRAPFLQIHVERAARGATRPTIHSRFRSSRREVGFGKSLHGPFLHFIEERECPFCSGCSEIAHEINVVFSAVTDRRYNQTDLPPHEGQESHALTLVGFD